MADITRLFAGPGPLPVTVPFDSPADAAVAFYAAGSAYTAAAGTIIGFDVAIDGTNYASVTVYANEANSHKALVASVAAVPWLKRGPHTLTLSPLAGTLTDPNDFLVVDLIL